MASRKKKSLPFDNVGGVLVIQRRMTKSAAYLKLPAAAKVLMVFMQLHWSNEKPIGYGVREAAENIPCDEKTASRAFRLLQAAGFIVMVDECLFNSRTQSKSRTWRLTWMPYESRKPTNDWEKIKNV